MFSGTPRPAPSRPSAPAAASSSASSGAPDNHALVMTFVVFLGIYVVWAFVAAHEKVRESVKPSNISLNLWNLAVIGFTVVIALNLLKITLGKLAAWGVPGADKALTVVGNA